MNSSFVVTLQDGENGELRAFLSRAEPNFADAAKSHKIVVEPPALPMPIGTRQRAIAYGRRMRDALAQHPAIEQAIQAIYMTGAQDQATLIFEITSATAEAYRWETICNDNEKFAAIDVPCLVSRVASNPGSPKVGTHSFEWPLRVAAFLSPAAISAAQELDEILSTAETAIQAGLQLECVVYLSEAKLIDKVQAEIDGGKDWLRVLPIPGTPEKFEQAIIDVDAQILHFFCHGRASTGVQWLEFATIRDRENDNSVGSSQIAPGRLTQLEAIRKCWLIVLNCCEGAGAIDQSYSMAFQLVADGGCPAAVGMNEPIQVSDATTFSHAFYTSLYRILRDVLAKGAAPVEIDLSPSVKAVRNKLYDLYAARPPDAFSRWSLPVLYVSREGLKVRVLPVDKATQERVDLVTKYLREMPPDMPMALRQNVLDILQQPPAVPKGLRPDLFGNFD